MIDLTKVLYCDFVVGITLTRSGTSVARGLTVATVSSASVTYCENDEGADVRMVLLLTFALCSGLSVVSFDLACSDESVFSIVYSERGMVLASSDEWRVYLELGGYAEHMIRCQEGHLGLQCQNSTLWKYGT